MARGVRRGGGGGVVKVSDEHGSLPGGVRYGVAPSMLGDPVPAIDCILACATHAMRHKNRSPRIKRPISDPCPPFCLGDIDEDCDVGINDFLLLLANWT